MTIGPRPDGQPRQAALEDPSGGGRRLGVSLAAVPESVRGRLGLEPGTSGLLIQHVEPGSPAAETGLRPGELRALEDKNDIQCTRVTVRGAINVHDEATQGKNNNARRTFQMSNLATAEVDGQRALPLQGDRHTFTVHLIYQSCT